MSGPPSRIASSNYDHPDHRSHAGATATVRFCELGLERAETMMTNADSVVITLGGSKATWLVGSPDRRPRRGGSGRIMPLIHDPVGPLLDTAALFGGNDARAVTLGTGAAR